MTTSDGDRGAVDFRAVFGTGKVSLPLAQPGGRGPQPVAAEASAAIDGRESVLAFAKNARGLSRAQFLERFPRPFVIQLNEGGAPAASDRSTLHFHTLALRTDVPRAPQSVLGHYIYPIAKRPRSNVFTHMITLGRAGNNDLIIPHPAVSKFHIGFVSVRPNEWNLVDSSSNGTWLNGERLLSHRQYRLTPGARITLAESILLAFLTPEVLYEHLDSASARLVL